MSLLEILIAFVLLAAVAAGFAIMFPEVLHGLFKRRLPVGLRSKPVGNVRIVMGRHGQGTVFIDGVKVERCAGFEVLAEAGELNRVYLRLHPEKIEVEGVFDVTTLEAESRRYQAGEPAIPARESR